MRGSWRTPRGRATPRARSGPSPASPPPFRSPSNRQEERVPMASKILFCPTQPPHIMEMVKALTPAGFELIPADVDTPQFYEAAAQAEYYLGFARRMGND